MVALALVLLITEVGIVNISCATGNTFKNNLPATHVIDKEFEFYGGELCIKNIIRDQFMTTIEFTLDFVADRDDVISHYYINMAPYKIAPVPGVHVTNGNARTTLISEWRESVLPDGSSGYPFIFPAPVYGDAVFDLDIRYLIGAIDSPETKMYSYIVAL